MSKDWIASYLVSRIRGPFLPGLACAQTPATQLGYSRSCTKRCKKGFCSSDLALELVVSRLCVNLPFFLQRNFCLGCVQTPQRPHEKRKKKIGEIDVTSLSPIFFEGRGHLSLREHVLLFYIRIPECKISLASFV